MVAAVTTQFPPPHVPCVESMEMTAMWNALKDKLKLKPRQVTTVRWSVGRGPQPRSER
jgi:hypothetical protein